VSSIGHTGFENVSGCERPLQIDHLAVHGGIWKQRARRIDVEGELAFMVRPDIRRLIPMSYASPLKTEWWDDDGSAEYKAMFKRIEREGIVLVKPS